MRWKTIAEEHPPITPTEDWNKPKLFLGWAVHDYPAVFYCSKLGLMSERISFCILADGEGLNNYTPTHWTELTEPSNV